LASTAAAFSSWSISAAAVKNAVRSSSALRGRVVDDVVLVEVEPMPFGPVAGVLVHDAHMRDTNRMATTGLRTTHLLL